MTRMSGWRSEWAVILFCALVSTGLRAQDVFATLVNFDGPNGNSPQMSLMQGADGNFYGTTYYGGSTALCCGTVFQLTPAGTLTTLYEFCSKKACIDGLEPMGSLVQASNGDFYGVTFSGGSNYSDCPRQACGTIFKISQTGVLTRFYSFCALANCADGGFPMGGLVQGRNGDLYGTTTDRGANNAGTVFKITLTRKISTLYNFCSQPNCADGGEAQGTLLQAFNGNFYGVTRFGGNNSACTGGCGTVFEITPGGKLTTIVAFDGVNGDYPSGLMQASNGEFYGATSNGGVSSSCPEDISDGCGTIFKTSSGGKLTTVHNFCSMTNCSDGINPMGPLVQATDGNFYGTTAFGGAYGWGTVFKITLAGELTTLYDFCSTANCSDGAIPEGGLLLATNGVLYGATQSGGTAGDGTIFSLDMGLTPFVSFIRNPAKIGQQFGILGYGLTGTTSVSFNGIAANFKLQSDTLLIATVPSGATTGYVTVTTPSGTLTSNVPFHVIR